MAVRNTWKTRTLSFCRHEQRHLDQIRRYAKAFPTKLVASLWAMGIRFLEGKVPGESHWSYELPLPAELSPKVAAAARRSST
jgi:hypothetical protein